MKIEQQLRFQQRLSPQHIQLMRMLHLPGASLEQRIKEEIEENPVLEDASDISTTDDDYESPIDDYESPVDDYDEDEKSFDNTDTETFNESFEDYMNDDEEEIPAYKLYSNNTSKDDERKDNPIAANRSFLDILSEQVLMLHLDKTQNIIARLILGNLNGAGYLIRDLEYLSDDLITTEGIEVSKEEIETVLKALQTLDPPGVCARNLQECLLIQIAKLPPSPHVSAAQKIIGKCFDEYSKKHYNKILLKLKLSHQELKDAEHIIQKLNPKPGNSMNENSRTIAYIIPDFIINIIDGEPILSLSSQNFPELRIKNSYVLMLNKLNFSKSDADKEASNYIMQKIESAKNFIELINQRQKTLYNTMQAIIDMQHEFFVTGEEISLKPMVLKDIADKIDMNISTVSRVVNSKYVYTPYGTYLLKSFFSESIANDEGDEISTKEVKAILQECVNNEDKKSPLTDDELMAYLNEKGYPVARRTVAKYRQLLDIPVARLRKQI